MRKTKIVCTIGPACDSKEMMRKMIDAGMNVARINMSHGVYDQLEVTIKNLKEAIAESGQNVAILLDTKGPEVRVGTFKDGSVELVEGAEFSLFKNKEEGDETGVSLSFPKLVDIFESEGQEAIGRELLLDDGIISLVVKSVNPESIVCTVNKGGVLKNRKSINIPGYFINMPYVSAQDRKDIEFGLNHGATVVAASFVRNHDDVRTLRDFIDSLGYEYVEIIAKIENQSGVDDMDAIIDYADGIMVARGDMGVEIPFIKLPEIQKTIIRKVVSRGKYVITATQMLESMTTAPRPTRAEISDVANAVYDGTSAVMLSAESAAGKYPIESVKALDAICSEAEENGEFTALHEYVEEHGMKDTNPIRSSICKAAKNIAQAVGAKAIIVESATGRVARAMVHYRPDCPVIAVATSQLVCRKLCLNWGVMAVMGEEKRTSDSITKQAMEKALSTGVVKKGDAPKPWVVPMPVLIIGTYNEDGTPNAMNAAWSGQWDMKEIMISMGSHVTTKNLDRNGEFTVAFATKNTMVASDFVGIVSAKNDPKKMEKTGWNIEKAIMVGAPVFTDFPMTLECRIKEKYDESETGYYLVAEIVNILVNEKYLAEDGNPDMEKMELIVLDPIHHGYIQLGDKVGKAFADGKALK